MSLRVRMFLFLAVLFAVAAWNPLPPLGIGLACAAYAVLILPKL